jgi:hypothetical protein
MKKLIVIFFLITGITLSFTGCLNTEGNYQVLPPVPAVVNYNSLKGGTTLLTYWDEIATQGLSTHSPGDCIIVQFKLDYDNQPASDYYTATEVAVIEDVEHSLARIEDEISVGDFTFPIEDMAVIDYNNITILDGKYFLSFKHEGVKNQLIEYRMLTSPNDKNEVNGTHNVYLVAKKKNEVEDGTTTTLINSHAFDMKNAILNLGRDTTTTYKYIMANLKFFTGKEEDKPVFKDYNSTPIKLIVHK